MAEIAKAMTAIWSKVEYEPNTPSELETPDSYAHSCRANNIDLAHSIVARDEHAQIIGLAMMGIRGERGWCGDFGIVPNWRGRGISHRLMAAFMERARSLGLRSLQLDVNAKNAPAIKIYEGAGFRNSRTFLGMWASRDDLSPNDSPTPADVSRVPLHLSTLLPWYGDPFSPPPIWQRELPSLLAVEKTWAGIASREGQERAFLLCYAETEAAMLAIRYLGLDPAAEISGLRALLSAALATVPAATQVASIGYLEAPRTLEWLTALGFQEKSRYLEMFLDLRPGDPES